MEEAELWVAPPPARLPPVLRPFVRGLFGYAADGLEPGVHRGLPGRALTLVLALDAPLGVAATAAAWEAGLLQRQAVTLGGLHTEPAFVLQPGRWSGLQIEIAPLGARRLFGLPAAGLPTDHFDARDVLGPGTDRLHAEVAGAESWVQRYRIVLAWLLDRLAATEPGQVRPEVVSAWRLLELRRGALAMQQLSDEVGLGSRRLAQVFRAELGVTPKVAARLIRFDAARRDVALACHGSGSRDLSGVAVRHGYYDHAHLVREFTAFTGLSPTGWLAAEVGNVQAQLAAQATGFSA